MLPHPTTRIKYNVAMGKKAAPKKSAAVAEKRKRSAANEPSIVEELDTPGASGSAGEERPQKTAAKNRQQTPHQKTAETLARDFKDWDDHLTKVREFGTPPQTLEARLLEKYKTM